MLEILSSIMSPGARPTRSQPVISTAAPSPGKLLRHSATKKAISKKTKKSGKVQAVADEPLPSLLTKRKKRPAAAIKSNWEMFLKKQKRSNGTEKSIVARFNEKEKASKKSRVKKRRQR